MTLTAENVMYRLRKRSFQAVLRQEIGWFDRQQTGKLMTRLVDDMDKIRKGVSDKLVICLQHLANFVASYVIAFAYDPSMAAIMSLTLPFIFFSSTGYFYITSKAVEKEQKSYAESGSIAGRALSAIRTVIAFGGERYELNEYSEKISKARKLELRRVAFGGFFFGMLYGVTYLGYGLGFWYGARQVSHGDVEVKDAMIVIFVTLMGTQSLGSTVPIFDILSSVSTSFIFIKSLIERVPSINAERSDGIKSENLTGLIKFSNVSFQYPTRPSVKVLKNFSMEVKPGQSVALVGPSGSGKTTVGKILQQFYSISEGRVTIDDVDIENFNLKWLREQIGIVSQEPTLFGCSIRENIEYGRENVTEDEIERAIDEANAREFIKKLPNGLNTLVGDKGSQLSGGQKQRIAIARALVRNPKILILDEATSALDSRTERIVQEALDKARAGRTTVVVAHRLSTIRDCDMIVVLKNGEIQESGPHEDLIRLNGLYAFMVREQSFEKATGQIDNVSSDIKRASLELQHNDVPIEVEVSQNCIDDTNQSEGPNIFKILALNRPEAWYIMIACIFALIGSSLTPIFSIFFGEMMATFSEPKEKIEDSAKIWCALFAILGVSVWVCYCVEAWALGESGSRLTERLRLRSFEAILKQDMSFFDATSVAVLTSRLAQDTALVQGASGVRLKSSLNAVGALVTGLVISFVFGWQLALFLLAVLPLIGVTASIQFKFANGFKQKRLAQASSIISEVISNIRTVQSFGLEKRFYRKYLKCIVSGRKSTMVSAHVYGIAQGLAQSATIFIIAATFRFSALLVAQSKMQSDDSFKVIFAIILASASLGAASSCVPDLAKARKAAQSLLLLFNQEPKINNLSNAGNHLSGLPTQVDDSGVVHIEFKDVHFSYPSRPDVKVMSGINLKIMKGKTVAFVGPSGCGKSTIMQLLQRFYDPEQGQIEIDGFDLKTLNIRQLRRQMAIVRQEPSLFNTSISGNIRYGALQENGEYDATITDDDVTRVGNEANLHEFVSRLPDGYETNVGEKGTQLSGGQKQRVAIARALIRNPGILLLDEATSALDSECEKKVQKALDAARVGRTCLVIAHRLTTIQNADEIAVIGLGGQIVQKGTHSELLNDPEGLYFKLCQAQQISQ